MIGNYRVLILLMFSLHTPQVFTASEWKNPDQASETAVKTQKQNLPVKKKVKPAQQEITLKGVHGVSVARICDYQRSYRDKGSGGKIDGTFYVPVLPSGFMWIGGYAQGNYDDPSACVTAIKVDQASANALLRPPDDWHRLWTDKGSGARMDGSIWHPAVNDDRFTCVGSVATEGYDKPVTTGYACLNRCLLQETPVAAPVWSTSGTGAKHKIYIYSLNNSNSFYASREKLIDSEVLDLKPDPQCEF